MTLTEDRLMHFLSTAFDVDQTELTPDTGLFSEGVLDSLSLADLLTYVEDEASITVTAEDVTLDNLDSVDRIVRFAAAKQTSSAS